MLSGFEGMKAREATIDAMFRALVSDAAVRLVELYETWGKPEQAVRWRGSLPPAEQESDPRR